MGKRRKTRVSEEDEEEQHHADPVPSSTSQASLYEVLGVERTATQQEIKRAYHKLALRLHPDKNPGDEEAKGKFQQLQKVISVLGDEEKRALYDQTGCVDVELAGDVQNLREFFRTMYKKVTEADIEEFEANYRGSESEKNDLINLYKKYKGNMERRAEVNQSISEMGYASETKPPTTPLVRKRNKNGGDSLSAPTEEEFEATKAKLERGKKSRKSKGK